MIEDIDKLIEEYLDWIKDKTSLRVVDTEWVEITTPYLDIHNDYLQIYVRKNENGYFTMTDAGYTLDDLEMSGCILSTEKRQDLLKRTLNGFGVILNAGDNALEVNLTEADFSLKKHNLIQAMLSVHDLFYLGQPIVESLFIEDVVAWLDEKDVRYVKNVKFAGVSGYDHFFDFVIAKSNEFPERVLKTISQPTRSYAESYMFAWSDTKGIREPESKAYAIINDIKKTPSADFKTALASYDILPINWSQRNEFERELRG